MASGSTPAGSRAALGFRAHSGWAALVAVAGPLEEPAAVLRRHIELSRRTPRQPFHAAEGLPAAAAEELVRRSSEEAAELAGRAVQDAIGELLAAGHQPAASGLLMAATRPLPGLRDVLASHALIHAAEGQFFRDVIRQACRRSGLVHVEAGERELEARAARALDRSVDEIRRRIVLWGRALGPPWTQDEKRAALVAWLALASNDSPQSR